MPTGDGAVDLLSEPVVLDDLGPARRDRAHSGAWISAALLLPGTAVLVGVVFWPVLRIVHASVTDPDDGFVGLRHFRATLEAEGAWSVFGRTLLWALVVPAVVTALGFGLAYVSRASPVGRVFGWVLVAPIALPLVVTGIAFRFVYDPDPGRGPATGIAVTLARWLGRDPETVPAWLGPELITFSLMSAFVWAWVGLGMIVFRTALDQIPRELADAVRAYGGSDGDIRRDVYWRPLLRRTVAIVFALVALATVRTFDLILVMAPGSVVDEASVLAVRQWQTSGGTTTGPGAALGTLWLAAVALGAFAAALWSRQAWPPPRPSPGTPRSGVVAPTGSVAPVPRGWSADLAHRARALLPAAAELVWLVPVLILLATSLHGALDAATGGWRARSLGLGSYREVFADSGLAGSVPVTAVLALVVSGVVIALALPAAFALAWSSRTTAQAASLTLLAAAIVPIQVIAGPVTDVLENTGVAGSLAGLGLVHVALGLPFAVLLLRNALGDLPREQVRQRRLTSHDRWRAPLRLALAPEAVPAIVAVLVLEFVQVYNDFAVGLLFSGPGVEPLGLTVYGQSRQFVANSGPLAAGCVVASVVPLALVVIARRQVVAGLVSGTIR